MCNLSWTPPPILRDHTSSWTTLEISLKTFVCYPANIMCSKTNQVSGTMYPQLGYRFVSVRAYPHTGGSCTLHFWGTVLLRYPPFDQPGSARFQQMSRRLRCSQSRTHRAWLRGCTLPFSLFIGIAKSRYVHTSLSSNACGIRLCSFLEGDHSDTTMARM